MTGHTLHAALGACVRLAAMLMTACASDGEGQLPGDDTKRLSAARNHFGFNLFHQVAAGDLGENIFISPASALGFKTPAEVEEQHQTVRSSDIRMV